MKPQNKLNPDEIDICPMTENEVNDILQIQTECGLATWTEQDYLKEIHQEDSIAEVAKSENGLVIGFVIVRLLMNSDNLFDNAEIYNIAVREKFQKKGIGQKLFNRLVSNLRKNNISEIWLEVRQSNIKAINFYEKNGFVKKFVRKDYYNNPSENGLILKYSLNKTYLT